MRDLRVLELAGSLAGAYCTRLFASTGAEVVLVEPPDGAPTRRLGPWIEDPDGRTRSATHEYLDAGKRSVVPAAGDAAFADAVRWADLVVSTCDGDLDATRDLHGRIVAADPSTVHAVASGFGLTGPYAGWRSSPLVDWASGGYLHVTGEPDREPLQGGGPWASYLAGVTLAVGAQAAVMHAARTGEGQLVDVGAMESVAHGHQWSLTMYSHTGASRVQDYAEVMRSEQLAARTILEDHPQLGPNARGPGRPFRIGDPAPLAPAPALGEHTAAHRSTWAAPAVRPALPSIVLSDVRMLEFTIAWAGPLAARILADLGVDVVKVEHPASRGFATSGNDADRPPWRWGELSPPVVRAEIFPDADPGEHPWNRMGVWNKMNRSKRSLCLDAKDDDGAAVLAALLADADLVVHNFTPRGAASLGIAPERLTALNGRLASVAMTGYGETGPMATHSSYGPMLEAFAGEALLATSATGAAPARHGNRSPDHAPQGVYPCAGDDTWVAVTIQGDVEWTTLVALVDDDGVLAGLATADVHARAAADDAIDDAVAAWTRQRSAADAAAALQAVGVAAAPDFTNRDLVEDEHLAARGFIATWDQPDVGRRRFPGFPIHFDRVPVRVGPAPSLGADNAAVLRGIGYDDGRIEDLLARGIIADRPPPP